MLLFLCSFICRGQEKTTSLELGGIPTLFFNSGYIGLSWSGANRTVQYAGLRSTFIIAADGRMTIHGEYGWRFHHKNERWYIPISFELSRINTLSHGYEEGSYYDYLRMSVNTGIGLKTNVKSHYFRFELAPGWCLRLRDTDPRPNSVENWFRFKPSIFKFVADDYPYLPTLRLAVRYGIPIKKKGAIE